MADASRDENRVTTLLGVSSTDGETPLKAEITAASGRLRVDSLGVAGSSIIGKVHITDGTDDADVVQIVDSTTNLDSTKGLVTNSVMYGRIDDTKFLPLKVDPSTQSLQTMGYEHHEIHGGSHYFVQSYADLAINHVLDFTWLMPDTTKWTHWTWHINVENETLWQIYEGAVATNPLANTITPLNSNRNSANTSGTTMKFEDQATLAAANADTNVAGATLIASGIAGSGREAGQSLRSNEIILDQGVLYCLRATSTVAGFVNFDMQWYEHTDAN